MMDELPMLGDELSMAWNQLGRWFERTFHVADLWQLGAVIVVVVLAWGLKRVLHEPMRAWIRSRERPMWQLRALLTLNARLWLICFTALMWVLAWASRLLPADMASYVVTLVATLATAWLAVVAGARFIRNPALRTLVRWSLWIYVTLWVLGLVDQAAEALDQMAVAFGGFRLSALALLKAAVALALLLSAARVLAHVSAARIRESEEISPSLKVLSVKILQVALYGVAFFAGLRLVGVDLTGLAVLSGAIGVGLGFGLQKVVSNLISGVIILLDKSIKPGDVISLGETFGWVGTLGARYASITTRDGKEYLIPNEDLITGQVVNWSHSNDFVRLDVHFGTAYGDDPHAVRKIAVEAAKSVPRVLSLRAPVCHIVGFGDSSVNYILRFWIRDPSSGLTNVRGDVYLALWDAFRDNDISIPFPQREVRVLGGEVRVEGASPSVQD